MRIDTLGCDGGIGGERRTTCYLVNQNILIDAGSGIMDLDLCDLNHIDHIFLTHSHFDHILGIPLLADCVHKNRLTPITVYALAETLASLKEHIFNWQIWPDFSALPNPEQPVLRFQPLSIAETVAIGEIKITALPVNHVVPAVGYSIVSPQSSVAISGDTSSCDEFWLHLNRMPNLDSLILETSFPNSQQALAMLSKHFCPSLLRSDLALLQHKPKIFISHLKPGFEATIMGEIMAACTDLDLCIQPLLNRHCVCF